MESRGEDTAKRPKNQVSIARRACDPCRARKVACDRGSPCANCITARVSCTHSAIASNTTPLKQRVLISAQYEQKIDDIARGISAINLLLKSPAVRLHDPGQDSPVKIEIEPEALRACGEEPLWDYSSHIAEFVNDFVRESGSEYADFDMTGVIPALTRLTHAIDGSPRLPHVPLGDSSFHGDNCFQVPYSESSIPMPPLEDAVAILRWAKEHEAYTKISWISRILPLEKFAEICRKVYFAVDDYSDVDFILANGYLYYMFSEHYVTSGLSKYKDYCCLCRFNLENTLRRLPLFLPASMEAIAALTLGAFNSVENRNATTAWTFVSAAWDLCQRVGYHQRRTLTKEEGSVHAVQERLFWNLYELDKGLALRLGRSSNIRESNITLPIELLESRSTRVARIQGELFDELCSPRAISRPIDERNYHVELLSSRLRIIMEETHDELLEATNERRNEHIDPMRVLYLQCDLLCQSSLLVLILQVPSSTRGSLGVISSHCIDVARDTLDMHERCLASMQDCNGIEYMMERYINWVILHTPFVSFSILFTSSIQRLDLAELAGLDRFAASLQSEPSLDPNPPITHPYRLYELLCRAARLYIYAHTPSESTEAILNQSVLSDALTEFNHSQFGGMATVATNMTGDSLETAGTDALSNWIFEDQMF